METPNVQEGQKEGEIIESPVVESPIPTTGDSFESDFGSEKIPASIRTFRDLDKSFLIRELITLEVSFETGEQTTHKIRFPYYALVKMVNVQVTKQLAGSNSGTLTFKNNGGTAMTNGVVTIPASTAVGALFSATPTRYNGIARRGYCQITAAKTTAGGRVRVEIEVWKLITTR